MPTYDIKWLKDTSGTKFFPITHVDAVRNTTGDDLQDLLDDKSDKVPVALTIPSGGMLPNVLYNLGTLSSNTTFTMASATDASQLNHWYWTFNTGSTVPTFTFPNTITSWVGDEPPTISANKHYEISVLGGVGAYLETE